MATRRQEDVRAGFATVSCQPSRGSLSTYERTDVSVRVGIDAVVRPAPRRAEYLPGHNKFDFIPSGRRNQEKPAFRLLCRELPEDFIRDLSVSRPYVPLVANPNLDLVPPFTVEI
jgi:hypothetical protein